MISSAALPQGGVEETADRVADLDLAETRELPDLARRHSGTLDGRAAAADPAGQALTSPDHPLQEQRLKQRLPDLLLSGRSTGIPSRHFHLSR
jgi:hypothetical protein